MNRNTLNTGIFRISFPLIYGIIVYILILVFFGSADQIIENFFSQEAVVCIILTFLVEEILLLFHKLAFKSKLKRHKLFKGGIVFISILIAILVVSISISIYFEYIIGLSTYKQELLIFNAIYLISALLYSLVWISIEYIQQESQKSIKKEAIIEENLRQEFNKLIYKTEPELFYSTLEHILSLLENEPDQADEYLNKLSAFYRYKLEMNNIELIDLQKELENAHLLIDLFNIKYSNNINLELNNCYSKEYKIVPFTITEILKRIIDENIINKTKPLLINLSIQNQKIIINYNCFLRLQKQQSICIEETDNEYLPTKKSIVIELEIQ